MDLNCVEQLEDAIKDSGFLEALEKWFNTHQYASIDGTIQAPTPIEQTECKVVIKE